MEHIAMVKVNICEQILYYGISRQLLDPLGATCKLQLTQLCEYVLLWYAFYKILEQNPMQQNIHQTQKTSINFAVMYCKIITKQQIYFLYYGTGCLLNDEHC
jgi:hypothetical protein